MESYYDHSDWVEGKDWPIGNDDTVVVGNNEFPPSLVPTGQVPGHGCSSWSVPVDVFGEGRAAASTSKSHSQAEKRRRDRINAQLATLRKLIPKSDKMDKAALLGSVIEEVKNLKRKASEVSKTFTIPTEIDEVTVDYYYDLSQDMTDKAKSRDSVFFQATLCCDDQPDVYSELITVIKTLKLNTVKADITSVGGRLRSNLVLCYKDCEEDGVSLSSVKQSLGVVLSRIASSVSPICRIRSKRQRLFFTTSHYSQ